MLSLWALSLLLITSHPLAISAFSTLPSPSNKSNKSHRRPYYLLFDSSLLSPDNGGPLLTLFATDDENNVNDDKQAADNAPPIPLVYLTENENNQTVDNVTTSTAYVIIIRLQNSILRQHNISTYLTCQYWYH